MTDTFQCTTPEGKEYELELPDVEVKTRWHCKHEVMVDNQCMEVIFAFRYLLADRERILTQLADLREQQQERAALSQKDDTGADAAGPEST